MALYLDNRFQQRYFKLPIAINDSEDPPQDTVVPVVHKHYHKEFEILGITAGGCDLTVDHTVFHAKEGDVLLIPPYSLHYGFSIPGEPFSHFCLCFDLSILQNDYFDRQFESGMIDITRQLHGSQTGTDVIFQIAYSTYLQCGNMQNGWEHIVQGQLLTLFGLLEQKNYIYSSIHDNGQEDFGQNVLNLLNQNYNQNITSRDIAALMSYSQSYFCRKFHATFDLTFQQYLCQYRLSKARLLLARENISVEETAHKVGFNHTGYFVRQFHAVYGCTPKQFQKSQVKGNIFQAYRSIN